MKDKTNKHINILKEWFDVNTQTRYSRIADGVDQIKLCYYNEGLQTEVIKLQKYKGFKAAYSPRTNKVYYREDND